MKGEKNEFYERKMEMWKKRDEMINSMDLKELRAFIKGYITGERAARKGRGMWRKWAWGQNNFGNQCNCGEKGCNCGKECNCEGK